MSMNYYINKIVELDILGKMIFVGRFIDFGLDIMVLYNGYDYLYIFFLYMYCLWEVLEEDYMVLCEIEENLIEESQWIFYCNILQQVKGKFIEIYVIGGKLLYGYIISVLNDYFVFYFLVYKNVFVFLYYLKWFIFYSNELIFYFLSDKEFLVRFVFVFFVRNFEEQFKKYEN